MEQARNLALDELCEEYGDVRAEINKLSVREKGIKSEALAEMQRATVTVYKHAGAVFSRVPGADKLNARLTDDTGDAGDEELRTEHVQTERSAEQLETAGA